jgi:hypothetical protein
VRIEDIRLRIDLIQKPSSIVLGEDSREAPGLLIERLHILNLQHQNITRLRCLDIERSGQVVDLGEVDIAHVISAVVVADLPTCPIYAFDFDDFIVLDGADGGDCILLVHY